MNQFKPLALFYFCYFALLGVLAPFLSLFLEAKGFSLLEIGQLVSILMLTKIVAPNVWGFIGDKTHQRLKLVRFGSLATLLMFLGFFWSVSFWHFAIVLILFSFFWNAVIPQFEVITLHMMSDKRDRYSQVRLWGSVGFIASVVFSGVLFDCYSIQLFPWLVLVIILSIWLASHANLSEPKGDRFDLDRSSSFYRILLKPSILAFFVSCFLLQLSHGAYYAYFSLYLESFGYDKSTIGLLWALGVLAEVVLFLVMHRWFEHHSVRSIMLVSFILTTVRWLLLAYEANNLPVLVFAQLIHAFSFGSLHAAAIKYVHATFGVHSQGRGQALYSSMGFGAGGGLGVFLSGYWVSQWGYHVAFELSAVAAFVALVIVFTWFPKQLKKMAH